jgi:hypothetical protein
MVPARGVSQGDQLVISLKVRPDASVVPGNVEVRGGLIRLRFMLPGETGLNGCFSAEARAMLQTLLLRLRGVVGVLVMGDFEARLPKVSLHECRATVGANAEGEELIALRFRSCRGDALSLFAQDKLPAEALAPAQEPNRADVLEGLLLPLFNLRQYLTDFPVEAVAADLERLDRVINGIAQQINLIEEGYYERSGLARQASSPESGVEREVSALMREALDHAQRRPPTPPGAVTLTYLQDAPASDPFAQKAPICRGAAGR